MKHPVYSAEALVFQCPMCRKEHFLVLHNNGRNSKAVAYYDGDIYAQDLQPEFTVEEAEVMVSGFCPACQAKLFNEPEPLSPYQVAKLFNERHTFVDNVMAHIQTGIKCFCYCVDIPEHPTDEQMDYMLSNDIDPTDEQFELEVDVVEAIEGYLEDKQ